MKIKKIPQAYTFEIEVSYDEYTTLVQSTKHLMHMYLDTDNEEVEWKNILPVVTFMEHLIQSKARHH